MPGSLSLLRYLGLAVVCTVALAACHRSTSVGLQAVRTPSPATLGFDPAPCGLPIYPGAEVKPDSSLTVSDPHAYGGKRMHTVELASRDPMDRIVGWYAAHWAGATRSGVAGEIIIFNRVSDSGMCEVEIYVAANTAIKYVVPVNRRVRAQ
ncbi:MAG: hypothetical protein ACRETA_03045 [Gammaproteobacteria bacterium]